MEFTSSSSVSTFQSVKERMREKLNGSLKAVKLQTSLAAKIKTKTLNNSSILKVSLKHNNKALACALTTEREKSRRLGNDIMFLQKEVKMLHFQNALLRQNLSIVNKMLKDIDVYMNINLPAAIEISGTMESSDRLSLNQTKSERFSQKSALSLDEDQGFRLTGMALRVPSHSVGQQKHGDQTIQRNDENHIIIPPSSFTTIAIENHDRLDNPEHNTLTFSSKEYSENRSRDSLSSVKVSDGILPLSEVFSYSNRNSQSGGFVTKRKKRSTMSHSSTVSKKSESNQTRSSAGTGLESSPNTHWELSTDVTVFPALGHTGLDRAETSSTDSALQKDRLSAVSHCSSLPQQLDTDQNRSADKDISKGLSKEQGVQSTNKPELVLNEEIGHHTVDGDVGQEKTIYEADMEMTSSESASIIAVLPKNKTKASKEKSGIPVKQSGTLRKVKSIRKKTGSSGEQVNSSSNGNKKGDEEKSIANVASDKHDFRRTYVLPGPVAEERLDVLESITQSHLEVSVARDPCAVGKMCPENTTVLNSGKSELTITVEKEAGNSADVAPKKRKSRNLKEASHVENSRKKKRKTHKNPKDQEQLAEENDFSHKPSEQISYGKKIVVVAEIHEPKPQRETYVISATKPIPVANDLKSRVQRVNHRRETFVVPEPNPLVSVTLKTSVLEERNDTFVQPQNYPNSRVPTDVSAKIANKPNATKANSEKEHFNPISDPDGAHDHKKQNSRCSEKKAPSVIFPELDKRKTYILPNKQDDFRSEKTTLARESFMRDAANKLLDVRTNKNDSFMLEMVSESILDNTMEFSSFTEFPSATNPDSTFTTDMSLKSIPAPELPGSEDCSNKETGLSNINVLDENDNGHGTDPYETETGENQPCKVEDQSVEIHETAIKPFRDLTNKSLGTTKQSPTSCSEDESLAYTRRRRNPVNYKEPSLGKKLRRGDSHTDTAFLTSPVTKGKSKKKREAK
ncbi:shugoshin 2 [Leptodactylus fuscus]|uniref:shugoshin 2 n=1 Tax=Leptodactylus fuscus TaxID=238119 RepID=UPI003F4E9D55